MKILGLIPVRGGSKGVPGKNIKILGTKPLIQYTLDAAQQSKLISRCIVSTDSQEIADCVNHIGGQVPFLRPDSLALDNSPTLPVIQHALHFYMEQGETYDAVCLLQATSPFRTPGFIDEAITRFIEMKCDALISVLPVPTEFNPHWTFEKSGNGFLRIATGEEKIISRRQDLPPAFFRDGSVYITKTNVLLNEGSLYGQTLGYIQSESMWHVNIDTLEDWKEAERMVEKYNERCAQ
ncbi:MAG TPA: acylneuraminate cytidylyltransferase family protein [Chryseolinea sp.]|nr:acylneuraminate cytidylyltransferase family protein [Chryseolinea sp.]HPM30066.1 acylneuraminate cytidylyltransferase family protein [Chryseolinea sp.]